MQAKSRSGMAIALGLCAVGLVLCGSKNRFSVNLDLVGGVNPEGVVVDLCGVEIPAAERSEGRLVFHGRIDCEGSAALIYTVPGERAIICSIGYVTTGFDLFHRDVRFDGRSAVIERSTVCWFCPLSTQSPTPNHTSSSEPSVMDCRSTN